MDQKLNVVRTVIALGAAISIFEPTEAFTKITSSNKFSILNAPPQGSPASARLKELWNVIRHFPDKTVWRRTGFIVDREYHFTPGITAYGNE